VIISLADRTYATERPLTITLEDFDRIRAAVDALPSDVGGLIDALTPERADVARSRSASERAQHGHGEAQETVNSQANLLLEAAGDYLFALPRLLAAPAMAIAPYACARGVLESCSQLLWLLDPQIDGSTRLGRSLALRFRGVKEQLKLYRSQGNAAKVDALLARIQLIEQTADARGIEVHSNARGEIDRVGPTFPPATALATEYLNAGHSYRFLSAVTHSQGSFILATSFKTTGRKGWMEKHLNTDVATFLLLEPAGWFARAAWEYLSYLGLADDRMVALLDGAYDKFGLGPTARFWQAPGSHSS
jgi:hypothetical protein